MSCLLLQKQDTLRIVNNVDSPAYSPGQNLENSDSYIR